MSLHQIIYTSCKRGINGVNDGQQVFSYDIGFTNYNSDEIKALFGYQLPSLAPGVIMTEELALTMPKSYVYRKLDDGRCALALNTYLGRDYMGSSGRFGNHLSHVVVFDESDIQNYPCEFYQGPLLRSSMTYEEVNNPEKPDYLPTPILEKGYKVDVDSVIEFLGIGNRLEIYKNMLCAMLAFSSQRKRVVICDDEQNIIMWIGALEYALPIRNVLEINFSTYDFNPSLSTSQICGVLSEGTRFNSDSVNHHFVFDIKKDIIPNFDKDPDFFDFIDTAMSLSYESLQDFHNFLSSGYHYYSADEEIYDAYRLYSMLSDEVISNSKEILDSALNFARKYANDGQESRIYNAGTNHYDVYASGEFRYNMGGNYPSLRDSLNHTLTNLPNPKYNLMFGNFVVDTMTSFSMEGITMPYEINIRDYNHNLPEIFKNAALGDEIILNWSSYRSTPTAVIGLGNAYEDRAPDYYIGGYDVKLQDNVYLSEDYYYPMPEGWSAYDRAFVDLRWQWLRGVIYSVMSYYDWVLIHYYVPVPKGLWYKYNDEDIRMPENGMFDLMTGQFYPNWHYPTGQSTYYGYEDGHRPNIKDMRDTADVRGATGDGKDFIFLRKQKVSESLAYDYFDDWDFSTHNYSSIKRTVNSGVKAYKKPDLYAIEMNELESGTIVPTSEWTDDAANNVVGTWYRSGGEWIQGTDLETVTGYSVVPVDYTTTLLTGGQYASVPGRKDPKGTVSASYGTGPVVIHGYYEYTNTAGTKFIFDGKYWFSWQQSTRNLIPSDKVFAVATSTTTYSQPIQDAAYAQDRFLPGDRINVIGQVSTGNAWYYCSRGWFWAGTTVSEVL